MQKQIPSVTAGHEQHDGRVTHQQRSGVHEGHDSTHDAHVNHTGHEQMFHQRFWISLILTVPVLLYSPAIQSWLGFTMPSFPGSQWVTPLFGVIIFLYGGLPFLRMAVPELRNRQPGMMMLISLAISVAFVHSVAALFILSGRTFF